MRFPCPGFCVGVGRSILTKHRFIGQFMSMPEKWNLQAYRIMRWISSAQWDAVIDMMSTKFKSHGYDMICTDGFLPQTARDGSVYMTHYGSMPLKTLISKCRVNGMRVGVYDNPLWIKGILMQKFRVRTIRYVP